MSDTPRTDQVCIDLPPDGLSALIGALTFARQLERELNEAVEILERLAEDLEDGVWQQTKEHIRAFLTKRGKA